MITINTVSASKFSYNGINYFKNFTPVVSGNKISILNTYDACISLTSAPTHFSEYVVNGQTFASVALLQDALLPIIFTKSGLFTTQWGEIGGSISAQSDLQNVLNSKADLVAGVVPASQLPSYVDDVLEFANFAAFPTTGEPGKIYIALDNNKVYRWSGSAYIEVAANSGVWGAITGTLSNQTDLQNALNLKANDNAVVKLTGTQSIDGDKIFTTANRTTFQNNDYVQIRFINTTDLTKYLDIGYGSTANIISSTGLNFRVGGLSSNALLIASNENATFKENLTAKSFIRNGGTSSQFLKADGSVDSSTYLTSLNGAVLTTTNQTIAGNKTFTGETLFTSGATSWDSSGSNILFFKTNGNQTANLNFSTSFSQFTSFASSGYLFNGNIGGVNSNLLILNQNGAGTFKSSVTATSFIRIGGNSTQFLKADGSIDGTSYQPLLTNPITGTGTTNYLPKFTGSTSLGNSLIFDNGTNVGIGTTSPATKFDVIDSSNTFAAKIQGSGGSNFVGIGTAGGVTNGIPSIQGFTANFASTTNLALQPNGGNVGIGTTSPTSKLHVVGLPSYADNTTALAGGLTVGAFYHTAGVLKVVI